MPDDRAPNVFGQFYEAHMGEVAENLATLKALLDRDYLLRKPEADAYLKVCALLLLTTCRLLGEISAPDFGKGPAPGGSDDLRCRRTEPLFTEASRQLLPFEHLDGAIVQVRRDQSLTHDEIQQIHDAAEHLLFGPASEPQAVDCEATLQRLKDAEARLSAFLRRHLVLLPEWDRSAVVEVKGAGDVDVRFLPTP